MEFIQTLAALAVTLGVLITFHEYGHYWVARRCGVKVLRFSVGFGRPLLRWHNKEGTEFVLAAIPLGGYVKMLDEREGDVPPELVEQSFNRKTVGQRFAIVAAGPLANFLLAIVAYWLVFVIGTQVVAPIVGQVEAESPAAIAGLQAGDELISIDGRATPGWQAVGLALLSRMGESRDLSIQVQDEWGQQRQLTLTLDRFLAGQTDPDPFTSLGIRPWRPEVQPILDTIQAGGAAAQAGLRPGDRILQVNHQPIASWSELVDWLQGHPETALTLRLERDGQEQERVIIPAARQLESGQQIGFIGAGVQMPSWPEELLREQRFGPLEASWRAVQKTGEMSQLTLVSIGKMISGLISPTNLSGPITIARVANDSVKSGWESFITFLAYVSISLAILNLLPIPVLDGGHLLFYAIEAVRGKPVSEQAQAVATRFGLAILGSLMLMAFYFDLLRLG